MHKFNLALAAAGAAVLTLSAPAFAAAPDVVVSSITVKTGDLKLDTDAGAQVLLRRIQVAARRACGGQPDLRDLNQVRTYDVCLHGTVDKAVADSGSARLAALHRGDQRAPAALAAR